MTKNEEVKEEVKEEVQENPTMVSKAFEAVEAMKLENVRMEKNIASMQELKSFEALGGKTEGAPQHETPKEIDPIEYSKQALAGNIPEKAEE